MSGFGKIGENKELISKYPFLLPHNRWTDEVDPEYDYTYTELDAMPDGWRKVFGEQLCEELKQELIKINYLDKYRIMQIKEKFGGLRWYDNGRTNAMNDIIHKYYELSCKTCVRCGAPATKVSTGWISPWCDECAQTFQDNFVPIEEYYK